MNVKTRDARIDLLRFLGTALVILCHAGPSGTINAWRSFDVPLLVMISGASFYLSYRGVDYPQYILKRFKRLVLPVWVFLTVYIPAENLMRLALGRKLIGWGWILSSYALIEGISYVWIFRVYFLVACISPLLLSMYKRLGTGKFLLVLLAVYPVYELFVSYITAQTSLWAEAVELTVVYAVGYGFICGIGIVLHDTTRTQRACIYLVCAALVAAMLCRDGVSVSSIVKFPPRTLYIAGGLLVSVLLWRLFELPLFDALKSCRAVRWVSENSMWLYLWHIAPVRMACSGGIPFLNNSWVVRYIFILAVAFILTVIHNRVLKLISRHTKKPLPSWL